MTTHPNDVPKYSLTAEDREAMFERQMERLSRDRDQRQRDAEWPMLVNELLQTLAGRVQALEAEVAALRQG